MSEAIYTWADASAGGAAIFFLTLFACLGWASYLVHKRKLLPAIPFITGIGILTYIYINGLIASEGLSEEPFLQVVGVIVPAAAILTPFLSYPGDVKKKEDG